MSDTWGKSFLDRCREIREDHAGYYARRELERRQFGEPVPTSPEGRALAEYRTLVKVHASGFERRRREQAAAQSDASDFPTKRATPPQPSPAHKWCDDLDMWLFDPQADVSPALRPNIHGLGPDTPGGDNPHYRPPALRSREFEAAPMLDRPGFFASLSAEQKAQVLAYDGPENHGDPNGPRHAGPHVPEMVADLYAGELDALLSDRGPGKPVNHIKDVLEPL